MSISFACLSCGAKLKAPDNAAGRSLKCPDCKAAVTIPTPQRIDAPPPAWKPVDEPKNKRTREPGQRSNRLLLYGGIGAGVGCLTLVVGAVVLIGVVVLAKRSATSATTETDAGPKPVMNLSAYKVQRPAGGARITGKCELFQNSGGIYGITIYSDDKSESVFAAADSKAGQDLMASLKDGKAHVLTLEIKPTTYKNQFGWDMDGSNLLRVIGEQASADPPKPETAKRDEPKPTPPPRNDPKTEPPKPAPEPKFPPIEITQALKSLGAKFSDWKATSGNFSVGIECKVMAVTQAIDYHFVGQTIKVQYYDREGVVYKENPGLGLELKQGETARISFRLHSGLKLSDVTKIVLDCD